MTKLRSMTLTLLFFIGAIPLAGFLAMLTEGFIWQRFATFQTPGMIIARWADLPKNWDPVGTITLIDSLLWFAVICGVFAAFRFLRHRSPSST